jgi:hypothetical protein
VLIDLVETPTDWIKKNLALNISPNFLKENPNQSSENITLKEEPPIKIVPSKSPAAYTKSPETLLSKLPTPKQKPQMIQQKPKVSIKSEGLVLEVQSDGTLIESKAVPEKSQIITIPSNLISQPTGRGQVHQLIITKPKTGIVLNKLSMNPAKKIKLDQSESVALNSQNQNIDVKAKEQIFEPEKILTPVLPDPPSNVDIITPAPAPSAPGIDPALLAQALNTIEDYKKNFEELKELVARKSDAKPAEKPAAPKIESLNMTKVQLFNGIKKYLNPSMVSLLRIELFGTQEREYKTDEKTLSIELLKLGENVYNYFRDEMRFRLPNSQIVEQWIQEGENMVDLEDAC